MLTPLVATVPGLQKDHEKLRPEKKRVVIVSTELVKKLETLLVSSRVSRNEKIANFVPGRLLRLAMEVRSKFSFVVKENIQQTGIFLHRKHSAFGQKVINLLDPVESYGPLTLWMCHWPLYLLHDRRILHPSHQSIAIVTKSLFKHVYY